MVHLVIQCILYIELVSGSMRLDMKDCMLVLINCVLLRTIEYNALLDLSLVYCYPKLTVSVYLLPRKLSC